VGVDLSGAPLARLEAVMMVMVKVPAERSHERASLL